MPKESLPTNEEGTIAKVIESYTSAVPSGTYLSLAVGAIGLSAILKLAGRNQGAQFVGHWVPTILILGRLQQARQSPRVGVTRRGSLLTFQPVCYARVQPEIHQGENRS